MALNIISNFAANVAQRNLANTDMDVTASLTKLSSGTRVVSAKDDAASLAIGSRLRAEVEALSQASVNAGQAGSLLQIADGALSTTADILVRMKSLAVQSSSGQLADSERAVLDSEFQALRSEIDRISNDTEFNGKKLISGDAAVVTASVGETLANEGFTIAYDTSVSVDGDAYRLSYDTVTAVAQVNNVTVGGTVASGDVFNIVITDNTAGTTLTASFTATDTSATTTATGLATAINNLTQGTAGATSSATVVTLTADTAGQEFSIAVTKTSALGTLNDTNTAANVKGEDNLTLTNLTSGNAVTIDTKAALDAAGSGADGANLVGTETAKIEFSSLGITLTLDANFDRTADNNLSNLGTLTSTSAGTITFSASSITFDANGGVSNAALKELIASTDFNTTTGLLTVSIANNSTAVSFKSDNIDFGGVDGGSNGAGVASDDLVGATQNDIQLVIQGESVGTIALGTVALTGSTDGTFTVDLGSLMFGQDTVSGGGDTSFTFKVGSGNDVNADDLTITIKAASASALGISSQSNIATSAASASASTSVSAAIDTLNTTRADIGASQNRLSFAAANLASSIINAEAARSELLDLNIASEITVFTSKQVLLQAGVSMLAQANQLPSNLLRLLQ